MKYKKTNLVDVVYCTLVVMQIHNNIKMKSLIIFYSLLSLSRNNTPFSDKLGSSVESN